jgi:hypothetical protein
VSSPVYNAVVCLYAQDAGLNPRRCDASQAATAWMIVDRVLELRGCSERIGRFMARMYVATCIPEPAIEVTLDALEAEAVEIVTPAFQERVRLLAAHVH